MLRANEPALQVLQDGRWQYVFCRNGGRIITTADRQKALHGEWDLAWFASKFGNHQFRTDKEPAHV
jgi:hypothetical protein